MNKRERVSTEPYKGVRDFYPEDQFLQRYLFEHMERVCELYGYEEYNASVLEPAELYRSKTSEEIVNEQTYTFTDRGQREVTLRPEMTPTLARMVAAKAREIPLPARLYSIPNLFRYERSQRGRVREHWQLNVDLLGAEGIHADAEIITVAHGVLRSLGADERDFEIRVSDRRILESIYHSIGIAEKYAADVTRLLDKRAKIDDFEKQLTDLIAHEEKAVRLVEELERITSTKYLEDLRVQLEHMGVGNMIVDTSITRGFDYYTGMIFEVYDTNEKNARSLLGGGRYDNLLSMFSSGGGSASGGGALHIPAIGFGMGDVTARDFLETHNLLPEYAPATELMVCIVAESATQHAIALAQDLRRQDIAVAVNFSGKRIGDQIKDADKMKVPFIIVVGEKERDSGRYSLKNLETGNEVILAADRIAEHLFSALE